MPLREQKVGEDVQVVGMRGQLLVVDMTAFMIFPADYCAWKQTASWFAPRSTSASREAVLRSASALSNHSRVISFIHYSSAVEGRTDKRVELTVAALDDFRQFRE